MKQISNGKSPGQGAEKYFRFFRTLSAREQRCVYLLVYTLVFAVCFSAAFFQFALQNKSFLWTTDGGPVLYPAFEYMGTYIRDALGSLFKTGSFPFQEFDFTLGMGKSLMEFAGTWYLEPLSLLSAVFPREIGPFVYDGLVILRFYLTGLAFSAFARHKNQSYSSTLLGAVVYTFSLNALCTGIKFPLFLSPMMYLPIMLIGMDRLIHAGKTRLLTVMVFLSVWTSYYFFYINTIFLGIYFLVEFIYSRVGTNSSRKETLAAFFKAAGRIVLSYALGAMMAAVVLLPNLLVLLNSNRGSGALNFESPWHYAWWYYRNLLLHFTFPNLEYSIGYFVILGILPFASFSVVAVILGGRGSRRLRTYLWIASALLLVPIFGYIFAGFDSINSRWVYGFVFLMSYIFCCCVPRMQRLSAGVTAVCVGGVLVYACYAVWSFARNLIEDQHRDITYYFLAGAVLLVLSAVLLLAGRRMGRPAFLTSTLALCVLSVAAYGYFLGSPKYMNYTAEFTGKNEIRDVVYSAPGGSVLAENDPSFFRVETPEGQRSHLGSAALMGYHGVANYSNVLNTWQYDYMLSVENAGLQENIMCYDLDGRACLDALASVKYIACGPEWSSYIPYGYTLLSENTGAGNAVDLWRNEYALPLGYTYDDYILYEDYADLSALEKQETALRSVVLEEEVEGMPRTGKGELSLHSAPVAYQIEEMSNISQDGTFYQVGPGGGVIRLSFETPGNAETYVRLCNLNISASTYGEWRWYVDNGSGSGKLVYVMTDTNYYRPDSHDYLVNIGYSAEPRTGCTIFIPLAGVFTLDDIQVLAQTFDSYAADIDALREDVLEDLVMDRDWIVGKITLEKDKILCLSIPYGDGWSATVDGEQVQLLRANEAYMALPLRAGSHRIELRYEMPGVRAGACVSAAGMALFLIVPAVGWLRSRRKRA